MFCSKCGKTIDDNATFCGFCGNPVGQAANAPQNSAPQNTMPQYGTPQYGAPQYGGNGGASFMAIMGNLSGKVVDYINKSVRGSLIMLSILTIIGSIGSMVSVVGFAKKDLFGVMAATHIDSFYYLSRVPAIIAFSLSILALAFSILTKQRSLFSYISACSGVLMFIFNFVMYGGYKSFLKTFFSSKIQTGGVVVAGIFLIIGSLAMIASCAVMILRKEDIIKFKPKF